MTTQPPGMDNKHKLQLAVRRNTGKKLLPKMMADVSVALSQDASQLRLADLEATDEAWSAFTSSWKEYKEKDTDIVLKTWGVEDLLEARGYLDKVRAQVPDTPVFLFRPFLSEYCGAIETSSHQILHHAFDLVELDDNDVFASSLNGRSGIVVSYSTQRGIAESYQMYEFSSWGVFCPKGL